MSHYSAIGDIISCDAPYRAIGFRGQVFPAMPPLLGLSLDCDIDPTSSIWMRLRTPFVRTPFPRPLLYFRKEPEGGNAKGKNFENFAEEKSSQKIFQKISQKTEVVTPRRSNPPQWTLFASRRQIFTPTLRLVQNPLNGRQVPWSAWSKPPIL